MDIKSAIAAERGEFAEVLDGLAAEDWDAPSLCAGWRVREVAAHMSLGFRCPLPRMMRELIVARGSLHRMTDQCARKDAARMTTGEMASALRDNARHPWKPPVGGITAALGHDVVHGLDITVALGHEREVPQERVAALLAVVTPKTVKFFGADLGGVELYAEDLGWSYGTGSRLSGSAQDLLLLTYGRKLPPGRLRGEAAERFALRLPEPTGSDG
ncbi:maleylpyruvate isomerase family mycothiol-dependent enzyme [Streptomyces sp. NBC_01186]|uniref:maleylpyruvate isomerase family mycothiol-dependent enzyme n=1 Tax=Streptomyces sp. NBC_01186 TaxID=2903765 RepID=UPI002E0FFB3C|nr:maleylpyruvate isomerase family mycothiol-dependent enzyme [Streptomyces sp. NBC_01186]